MKAMIFAAGLGTRLKPFTERHPKALAEVNKKPLLQRNIEYLKSFGIRELVINVHHFPDQIISFLNKNKNFDCDIVLSDESNSLLETGGGLKKASTYLKGDKPFLVMNTDILTDLDLNKMITAHKHSQALATLAVTERKTSRYFLFNGQNELCGWKNVTSGEERIMRSEPNLSPKAFSGVHIIEPEIFSLMQREGKFSIVDIYLELCSDHIIKAFDHSSGLLIDVGRPEAIEKAEQLFK